MQTPLTDSTTKGKGHVEDAGTGPVSPKTGKGEGKTQTGPSSAANKAKKLQPFKFNQPPPGRSTMKYANERLPARQRSNSAPTKTTSRPDPTTPAPSEDISLESVEGRDKPDIEETGTINATVEEAGEPEVSLKDRVSKLEEYLKEHDKEVAKIIGVASVIVVVGAIAAMPATGGASGIIALVPLIIMLSALTAGGVVGVAALAYIIHKTLEAEKEMKEEKKGAKLSVGEASSGAAPPTTATVTGKDEVKVDKDSAAWRLFDRIGKPGEGEVCDEAWQEKHAKEIKLEEALDKLKEMKANSNDDAEALITLLNGIIDDKDFTDFKLLNNTGFKQAAIRQINYTLDLPPEALTDDNRTELNKIRMTLGH